MYAGLSCSGISRRGEEMDIAKFKIISHCFLDLNLRKISCHEMRQLMLGK